MRNFLKFFPKVAVILNVEEDHLDYYKDIDDIISAFSDFASLVPDDGFVGQTSIKMRVTDGHNDATEHIIDVYVGIEPPVTSESTDTTPQNEPNAFPWNIVVYVLAGVAVLAAVLVVLFYGKKK